MSVFECQSCGAFIEKQLNQIASICPFCNSRNIKSCDAGKELLNLECPFCGGAFSLPDSYNMSRCPYCSRSIFIQMAKDILQFFFEPSGSSEQYIESAKSMGFEERKKTIYLPFWAIRGILVSWVMGYRKVEAPRTSQVKGSYAASYQAGVPATAGSIYIKEQKSFQDFKSRLIFISMGDYAARMIRNYTLGTRIYIDKLHIKNVDRLAENSDILKPLFDPGEAVDKLLDTAHRPPAASSESVVVQASRLDLVGKKFLLIYVPFYRFSKAGESLLFDSFTRESYRISERVLFDPQPKKIEDNIYSYRVSSTPGEKQYSVGALDLVPFSCPECGADLPAKMLDCFVQCVNCKSNLVIENGVLKKISAYYVETPSGFLKKTGGYRVKYYPYWRYRSIFYSNGKKIESISRLKFLFTGFIDRYERNAEFKNIFMYIPAFGRINSPGLDKISALYTKSQIVYEYSGEGRENYERAAVIYDDDDARNLSYTILLKTSNLNKSSNINRLRNTFLRLSQPRLFYFPFLVSPVGMHMDPVLGLNYMKNSFVAERSY